MRATTTIYGALLLAAGLSGGCLQKDETETIYLGGAGVTWTAIEANVRSDETPPARRVEEERGFFAAADAGAHPTAQAFWRLGAQSVTTTWLRRDRPYAVMTDARFADLRLLAESILREAGLHGTVTLTRNACQTTFGVRLDMDADTATPADSDVGGLATALESYKFVLTDGHFVSADGFNIGDDRTIAVPDTKKIPVDGVLTLSLAWVAEACGSGA
jgi:hypothetical protein